MAAGPGRFRAIWLTVILGLCPRPLWAAEATGSVTTVSLWWQLGQVILLFGVVLAAAAAVTRLWGRQLIAGRPGQGLRVLEWVSLGPKRGVCAVEVGEAVLLLGVTDQQINLLAELDEGQRATLRQKMGAGRPASSVGFGQYLSRQLANRWGKSEKEAVPRPGKEGEDEQTR